MSIASKLGIEMEQFEQLVENLRKVGKDTQYCEVKESVGKLPSSIPETLSAFSNGDGGVLVLGLSEQTGFTPVEGFDACAMQDALADACEKMTPVVRPVIELVPFEGNVVLVAQVRSLTMQEKPCYVSARGLYRGTYIRTGDGDRQLTGYEVDRLVEGHRQPRWDACIVEEAGREDLNEVQVRKVVDRQRELHPAVFNYLSNEEILENLRILARTQDGTLKPTMAGLLSLGKYPQKFFPRLQVTFACYPETDAGAESQLRFLDSRNCVGSIPQMVADAVQAIVKNSRCGALIDGSFRKDVWDYPLVAVREAIANALQHRDYSDAAVSSPVSVNMYPDRLEIINPGGLYGTVTVENLGQPGVTASRNQFLSSILETTPYSGDRLVVENRGSGIPAIRKSLEESEMYPAEVLSTLSTFRITFFKRRRLDRKLRTVSGKSLERLILSELSEKPTVTVKDLMELSGMSRSTICGKLRRLVDQGEVEALEAGNSPKQKYRLAR